MRQILFHHSTFFITRDTTIDYVYGIWQYKILNIEKAISE